MKLPMGSSVIINNFTFAFFVASTSCVEGTYRLAIDQTGDTATKNLFINGEASSGRVEVCISGQYYTICDDNWENDDASEVCSSLGFSTAGKPVALSTFAFITPNIRISGQPLLVYFYFCVRVNV